MLIKVCGITNIDDSALTLRAGADWIGINLVAGPRRVDLSDAARILARLDDPSRAVILLALQDGRIPEPAEGLLDDYGIRRLQLYGQVTAEAVRRLATAGREIISPQPVTDEESLSSLDSLLAKCGDAPPAYVLFDAAGGSQLGGTGRRADWEVITAARSVGRYDDWPSILLAGGLDPTNVAEAIQTVRPVGVDVCSGVEAGPGRKDHAKLEAFIAAARAATTS